MTILKFVVLIPALNEAASIESVVKEALNVTADVVVIDDGSTDATSHLARSAGATVLRLPTNLGVGAALKCGFRYAFEKGFDTVIQCDADGQHDPSSIPNLIHAAEKTNADLVIGSRYLDGGFAPHVGKARRLAMWFLAKTASRATGTQITDVTSGFRLIRGELLQNFAQSFPAYYLGDTFEATYVAGKAGYQVVEVPAVINPREFGTSTASVRSAILMIAKALLTTAFGLHFALPRPAKVDS